MARYRSLYVHFPFCETKCHYCDFYSLGAERTRPEDRSTFASALAVEANLRAGELADTLETIFLGGGTPSMTDPKTMGEVLAPLNLRDRISPQTEWTMEANPSSVDLERLKGYQDLGVNRISMGVQALRDDHLEVLGRVHSKEAALRSLETIFKSGITNVSVDLLCGVPGQTPQDIRNAISTLLQYPITHLSCYLLTLPSKHRMAKDLPKEEKQLEHLMTIHEEMTAAGFRHYEISNYARPGYEARHNLNYWKGENYLGLGPSAHSFNAEHGIRWKNSSSIHKYAEILEENSFPIDFEETLTPHQRDLERWMLAIRLDEGFPKDWLNTVEREKKASNLKDEGLLEVHPELPKNLRLTPRGLALSDQIVDMLT